MFTEVFHAERTKALRDLDIAWARKNMPHASSDEVLMVAMHKARYEDIGIPNELRHESRRWLEERRYSRFAGLPWPADGSLPE